MRAVIFGEEDLVALIQAGLGQLDLGGEDELMAECALMLIDILEGLLGPRNADFGAKFLQEFAPESLLAGFSRLDRTTQGPHALHAATVGLDLGSQ
jgi:hypothetical protein